MNEIITSTKNDFVKTAKSLKSKKARTENHAFLIEGTKCVSELIEHRRELIEYLIVVENSHADTTTRLQRVGVKIVYVKEHVMNAISDCKTSQGIAVIASFPENVVPDEGFVLALDDVADPQNIGTIIRTADAAGCAGVVLSEDSADYLSPKAVRASMGSMFHLPVYKINLQEYLAELLEKDYSVVVAQTSGQQEYTFDLSKTCLVIGNESRGVSEGIAKLATDQIRIPMFGKAESLNAAVAAGILIYKLRT